MLRLPHAVCTDVRRRALRPQPVFQLVWRARDGHRARRATATTSIGGTPRDCVGCHQRRLPARHEPQPRGGGLPDHVRVVSPRHRPELSREPTFNHTPSSRCVGSHATQACASCHTNNVYKGTPRDCVGCHQADYHRADQPQPRGGGLPDRRVSRAIARPTAAGSAGASSTTRGLPAVGGARHQACAAATRTTSTRARRATASAATRPTTSAPTSPNHVAAGFPTTCESCHRDGDTSWTGASVQPRHGFPAGRARTPRRPARRATRTTSTRARRATASAATRPTTSGPRRRTTRRPASRPPATRATAPADTSWKSAASTTRRSFPLGGHPRHARPARACHRNNVYKGTPPRLHRLPPHNTTGRRARITRRRDSRPRASRATARRPELDRRDVQPQPVLRAGRAATPRPPAPPATRTTSYRGTPRECYPCHRRLPRAANPNHAPAGFPTPASRATATAGPGGRARASTTTRRSRSGAPTPARPARAATGTTSTRARPARASGVTRRSTTRPGPPTTARQAS